MKLHPLKLTTISCLKSRANLNLNGSLFLGHTVYIEQLKLITHKVIKEHCETKGKQ